MTKKIKEQLIKAEWSQLEIPMDQLIRWEIGDLIIWCKHIHNEIQITHHISNLKEKPSKPSSETIWSRWTIKKENPKLRFTPIYPNRPIVVKPESTFRLTKGAQVRVYVRIPIWVQIVLASHKTIQLIELPSVTLSNTWFGTFFDGELCYWISSGIWQRIEIDKKRPYLSICPLRLVNKADEDLVVEKSCLRINNLSIFSEEDQLWGDETQIIYEGENQINQVSVSGVPPAEAPRASLLSPPRNPAKKSLAAKTFASIKEFPGLGIPMN